MTGTLGLFSLVDLFQLLSSSSRTGRLLVDHPASTAKVYFNEGQVVHAEFAERQGEEAVYALFRDEQGSFEFRIGLPAPKTSIESGTENLLLEAIRRLDETKKTIVDEDEEDLDESAIPVMNEGADATNKLTLQAQEVMVLRQIDNTKTIKQLAIDADVPLAEVKQILLRLLRIAVIKLKSSKARVARLVTKLSSAKLPQRTVGIDRNIIESWERVLGQPTLRIACRDPEGQVRFFIAQPLDDVGPYILFSRDTLFSSDIGVNTALLVKPVDDTKLTFGTGS